MKKNADILRIAVEAATNSASREAASIFISPENSRSYNCSVVDCGRPAYAGGMCNAHYLRERKGKPLLVPVRARKRDDKCSECGKLTGAKGGWGLCQRHYRQKRYVLIKDALISAMGGKCERCGGVFHRSVFDFHHIGEKTDAPSVVIVNRSADDIAKELANCELLCANCHRMEHADGL